MKGSFRLILLTLGVLAVMALAPSRLSPAAAMAQDSHTEDEHAQPADDHAAASDDEHAAAGDHEQIGVLPSWLQAVAPSITTVFVFGIVLAVLSLVVFPKITKGLKDRENKIRQEIAAAEAARKQAKDALEQYEQSLSEARAEAKKMLDDTKIQQQKLAADLKATADVELGQLKDRARRDIEAAKRQAINDLYNDAANLATVIAGKILQRQVGTEDQKRLIEESLGELQSSKN